MTANIREPKQQRAIDKKEKIINVGFELMCENGYYNTNTIDIAKEANVSTGIIYQYFNDKKEIFLEGIKNYSNQIMFPIKDILSKEDIQREEMESIVNRIIDESVKSHNISKKEHEEIMAMSHLDEDVGNIFKSNELNTTKQIVKILEQNGIRIDNAMEKVHIGLNVIDQYCHEVVYHKHEGIDYEVMKKDVVEMILSILK